ncbi:MAG: sn-glycerol-3-phosphate ABC transporter ATP-binding protein UgpC [Elusimicrobia bacterium]|nr:sn-glycerol-3-phosphate ABC transporter ATP-binding protein UgpC [Elusimicrobiota bacterium]
MASVSLRKITKRYKDTEVLHDVSLDIADREFMILVGPSGCGKSTLLRMIAGLEECTEGEIVIDGAIVNHLPPREREIAMVFQDYALYPHMTVEQNMSFGLRLRKLPKSQIDARVKDAANILQIQPLLKRKPSQLSGGQRQRVAIGRAIVRKPKVFLFDEPLSNLDAKLREEMRIEIAKLHQRLQTTIIYVTHDQVEAMTLGSRMAVVNGGRIQQMGPPEEVFCRPANRFVAGFIGSPTMNFVRGAFSDIGEGPRFKDDVMSVDLPPLVDGELRKALLDGKPRPAVLGVRPDDVYVMQTEPKDAALATVEVVELLGHRKNLHLKAGKGKLLATVDASFAGAPGDRVSIAFNPGRLHLFDEATQERIALEARTAPRQGAQPTA